MGGVHKGKSKDLGHGGRKRSAKGKRKRPGRGAENAKQGRLRLRSSFGGPSKTENMEGLTRSKGKKTKKNAKRSSSRGVDAHPA